jgi:hypothetical protein
VEIYSLEKLTNKDRKMGKVCKFFSTETCILANISKVHLRDTENIIGKVEHFIEATSYLECGTERVSG